MARVFLSFHAADARIASGLAERLVLRGHEVVRFDESIAVGRKWEEEIALALRGADAIVILLTETSSQSPWLMHEAGVAMGYARERGKPILLPVVLGQAQIPPPIASIQAIISRDSDLATIADQLDRTLNRQVGRLRAQEEQQKEVARRVEDTAGDYIRRSRSELDGRETRYRRLAFLWYGLAFVSLASGVGFAVWRAFAAATLSGWIQLVELIALGLVVVGLLVGLSKLSFGLGKAFMVEALRNADRSHAISFGEFYLKAFGEHAAWADVKEAFQHWNVDKGSSFATQDAEEFDPKFAKMIIDVSRILKAGSKE